jgi:hypothetical protein
MTLVKIDRPRRIDQFIDYFGELRRPTSNGSPPPGTAIDPRETRPREVAYGWRWCPVLPLARKIQEAEAQFITDYEICCGPRAERELESVAEDAPHGFCTGK